MPETFTVAGYAIARVRTHYVVFGLNRGCMRRYSGIRVHGWMRDVPEARSLSAAFRHLQAYLQDPARMSTQGTSIVLHNGHHAGAERCVSGHCDDRFVTFTSYREASTGNILTGQQVQLMSRELVLNVDVHDYDGIAALTTATMPQPEPVIARPLVHIDVPAGFFEPAPPKGVPAKGIKSFGVEVECYIPRSTVNACADFCRQHNARIDWGSDGSLHTASPTQCSAEIGFWTTSFDELRVFMTKLFDEFGATTHADCGMHVHIKPFRARAWAFASKYYWDGFYTAYREFARGKGSKYLNRCTTHWCVMRQWNVNDTRNAAMGYGGYDRYSAINLQSLVHGTHTGRHFTIEHRIMPGATTAIEACEAVEWLVRTASQLITSVVLDSDTVAALSIVHGPLRIPAETLHAMNQRAADALAAAAPADVPEGA